MSIEFKLPELGENVQVGDVVNIFVAVGDTIKVDQPILELETDKAVLEVPSTVAGKVEEVLIKAGDQAKPGQVILRVANGDGAAAPAKAETKPASAEPAAPKAEPATPKAESKPASETPPPTDSSGAGQVVEFKLPELGENVGTGTVVNVLVSAGDTVKENQPVLELETDKAVLEVPSSVGGTVQEVFLKAGDQAGVGQKVMTVQTSGGALARPTAPSQEAPKQETPAAKTESAAPKAMPAQSPTPTADGQAPVAVSPSLAQAGQRLYETAPAAPSVRRFAREIGIDIHYVPGSGPGGRISVEDVKAFARKLNTETARPTVAPTAAPAASGGIAQKPLPDFSKWGEVAREPMSNIRRATAENLSYAWSTVPHVTQFDKADITDLEQLRKRYGKVVETAGAKLTPTVTILKVIAAALKKFPQFNASVDMEKREIVYKKYVSIGVAVDTPRGLLVPVIRNVDQKNLVQLAIELGEVSQKARDRKLSLDDMQGGNFNISNLGGIGGTGFAPIVNPPDVAILGVARASMEPVWVDGEFKPRLMMPLSLSYDHRLIDGADGARFLRWVCEALEQPFMLMLEG